ncbi:MAG: hypothetical protein PHE56_08205 [Bacteroidales bacterium]|nr:hypothetical protein [Bacteroidales bacterium]
MIIKYFDNIIKGSDRTEFLKKVNSGSKQLGLNPNWVLLVMNSETGGKFSASIKNPVSGAVGLIQFMPATAAALNTSTQQLSVMTRVQQLDYVFAYYKRFIDKGYKIKSYEDLYLITFYPYALTKPDSYIFGSEVSKARAAVIKQQNPFDYDGDGYISKSEFKKWIFKNKVQGKIPSDQMKYLSGDNSIFSSLAILAAAILTAKIIIP